MSRFHHHRPTTPLLLGTSSHVWQGVLERWSAHTPRLDSDEKISTWLALRCVHWNLRQKPMQLQRRRRQRPVRQWHRKRGTFAKPRLAGDRRRCTLCTRAPHRWRHTLSHGVSRNRSALVCRTILAKGLRRHSHTHVIAIHHDWSRAEVRVRITPTICIPSKNTGKDRTMKQMFANLKKLIVGQSDEIYGVKTINWEDSSWTHLSLIGDLAREGLHIFRFCIMHWKDEREPSIKYCMGRQIDVVQKFTRTQSFGQNWWWANGIQVEHLPRIHHIAALPQSPRVTVKIERRTREIYWTDYLHVDVQRHLIGI